MKINKIRFANIHSLKGEHQIDFSSGFLAEAGLFAITGATGSGKSTLLDVITLALYNRIPRINKDITKNTILDLGSIMTRNTKHCFAEVEYSVNGDSYRSSWSIEKNRNDNLNSRKQEVVALPSGTIITEGKKSPEQNEKIIGLNYDQFVKAMVLSQGEFSKLLKAPRDERNKLLEHITGAKSYRQIGQAVFQRFSEAKRKVEDQQLKLNDVVLLTQDQITEINTELKVLNASKPDFEKKHNTAKSRIETYDLYQKTTEKLELKTKEFTRFKEQLKAFEVDKIKLTKHNKFVVFKELLSQFKTSSNNVKTIGEHIKGIKQQQVVAINAKQEGIYKASQLTKESLSAENISEKLEAFRVSVLKFQETERSTNKEALLFQNEIKSKRLELIGLDFQIPEITTPLALQKVMNGINEEIDGKIKSSGASNLEQLKAELNKTREDEKQLIALISDVKNYNAAIKVLTAKKDEYKKAETAITTCDKEISRLDKELEILEKEILILSKKVEEQNRHKSLEDHRHQLIDGEPCPLCGAIEHPYAIDTPVFNVEETLLKTQKDLFQNKKELRIEKITNKQHLQERNGVLNSEIKEEDQETFTKLNHIKAVTDRLKLEQSTDVHNLETHQNKLQTKITALEASEKAFHAVVKCKAILEDNEKWQKALEAYKSANSKRIELYEKEDVDAVVQSLLHTMTSTKTNLSSLTEQLQNQNKILKAETDKKVLFENDIQEILNKENLSSLEELQKTILDEGIAQNIREQQQRLENSRISIEGNLKQIKEDLKALELKIDKTVSKETLQTNFELAKSEWEGLLAKTATLIERLKQDQLSNQRFKETLEHLKALKKDQTLWKTMNNLIGDAHGKKFSNFVQDLTLEQLIGYANKRLQELSDRYILDIPTAEESDKNDTLKVFDIYMGNARRSVNTLSGGETFMVSLAMAFALSDLASKNVNIESLFIDEGFGTLDPDTLDQAITILEKMQNEGDKSIGVISHVAALKERITTQVQLEKSSLGYSTVSVIQ